MLLFLRGRKLEVVAHEIPYVPGLKGWLYKWQWKLAPKIVFHTANEVARFEQHYGIRLRKSRIEIRTHHDVFQKYSAHSRTSARRQLGLRQDKQIFLCIGFIQRHKGFHRAVRSFVQANLPQAELFIVGSLRVAYGENQRYLSELQDLVAGLSNVHLVESFVSNEDFDTWITASDDVVFPYSEIWSSGVLARTRLLERPAIVAAVGGLPDQVSEDDLLFNTDDELVAAFQSASSHHADTAVTGADNRTRGL
jgi:glycosyltransferase involved in cell wall biosynthesis